jgi:hypothetical protein
LEFWFENKPSGNPGVVGVGRNNEEVVKEKMVVGVAAAK